jgi:hypothetical protein
MTTFHLYCPSSLRHERSYAATIVLSHHLGVDFQLIPGAREDWLLKTEGDPQQLSMPDSFFSHALEEWLQPASLPKQPLPEWKVHEELPEADLVLPHFPVIAGRPSQCGGWFSHLEGSVWYLGLDVLGAVFFMLSRYEEVVIKERDHRDRFSARSSLAFNEGFLERPIVDEYVETLFCAIRRLWPGLAKAKPVGRILPTCDVDTPYDPGSRSIAALIRFTGADVLRRHDIATALKRIRNARPSRKNDFSNDVNNTFAWLMDTCEFRGFPMTFYFIAGRSGGAIDGSYSLSEPFLQELLREVDARGHEIGMHASYNTYRDPAQLKQERRALSEACHAAGVSARIRGNRQHYLRWDSAVTPRFLEAAGFEYDATGSFADWAGFRFGTARSFPMWDWQTARTIGLKERPLILMESSVIAKRYMGLGYTDAALERMIELRDRALKYGGNFVFLWHNTHFTRGEDRDFFTALLTPSA